MTKKTKIFIDGREGTTGLKILERFAGRDDLELIAIPDALRKAPAARAERLNAADIAFLCLPDDAAREAVAMVTNPTRGLLTHRRRTAPSKAGPTASRSCPGRIVRRSGWGSVWRCRAAMPAVFWRWPTRCARQAFCPPTTRWFVTR